MVENKGIKNLEQGFNIVQKEYDNALSQFKEIDNKFSILLVFVAGEIAAFGATLSSISDVGWFKIAYISLFCLFIFVGVALILFGLFTRKIELIKTAEFEEYNIYLSTKIQFLLDYIATYNNCIKSIKKQIQKKTLIFNATVFFVLLALLVFVVFSIISNKIGNPQV